MNEIKTEKPTGLALLRMPFEKHQISKLPKPTKQQTDEVKADFQKGTRCDICGGWHHPKVVHLDYVGHAALTDRLLEADPNWNWEPQALDSLGAPKFDGNNGLWIKLTVCGISRLGYGHADSKTGGDAVKEVIGDALRNAAMRFGAALDLWHKGDLHPDPEAEKQPEKKTDKPKFTPTPKPAAQSQDIGEYVVKIGKKYKDMMLKEMLPQELTGYIKYVKEGSASTGNILSGDWAEFVEVGTKYCNLKGIALENEVPF